MSDRRFFDPPGREGMRQRFHFSQGAQVGKTVYVSGQGGWDNAFKLADNVREQTRQAFRNIEGVLGEVGGSLADVVEISSFHLDMDQLDVVVEVLREMFPNHCPAWTAVGVTRLATPAMLVEIRATAVLS